MISPKLLPLMGSTSNTDDTEFKVTKGVAVCNVHPSEPATLQCIGCIKAKTISKSYHCSTECFADSWRQHRSLHTRAANAVQDNGPEEEELFGSFNGSGSVNSAVGATLLALSNGTLPDHPFPLQPSQYYMSLMPSLHFDLCLLRSCPSRNRQSSSGHSFALGALLVELPRVSIPRCRLSRSRSIPPPLKETILQRGNLMMDWNKGRRGSSSCRHRNISNRSLEEEQEDRSMEEEQEDQSMEEGQEEERQDLHSDVAPRIVVSDAPLIHISPFVDRLDIMEVFDHIALQNPSPRMPSPARVLRAISPNLPPSPASPLPQFPEPEENKENSPFQTPPQQQQQQRVQIPMETPPTHVSFRRRFSLGSPTIM